MDVNEFLEAIVDITDAVYDVGVSNKFKKQLELAFKRNLNLELLKDVVYILAKGENLEHKYRMHKLQGFNEAVWECHVKPDWLLTWKYSDNQMVLILLETGTQSDLF